MAQPRKNVALGCGLIAVVLVGLIIFGLLLVKIFTGDSDAPSPKNGTPTITQTRTAWPTNPVSPPREPSPSSSTSSSTTKK